MNNIIKKLKKTIDQKLHLQQNQQGWLIPDKNTNIQARSPHRHSVGFSLDVSDSKQKPRKKQVRKGATAHRGNSGIQAFTQKNFTAGFEIQNHNLIVLHELIQKGNSP